MGKYYELEIGGSSTIDLDDLADELAPYLDGKLDISGTDIGEWLSSNDLSTHIAASDIRDAVLEVISEENIQVTVSKTEEPRIALLEERINALLRSLAQVPEISEAIGNIDDADTALILKSMGVEVV